MTQKPVALSDTHITFAFVDEGAAERAKGVIKNARINIKNRYAEFLNITPI
jgi:hypothetical protein